MRPKNLDEEQQGRAEKFKLKVLPRQFRLRANAEIGTLARTEPVLAHDPARVVRNLLDPMRRDLFPLSQVQVLQPGRARELNEVSIPGRKYCACQFGGRKCVASARRVPANRFVRGVIARGCNAVSDQEQKDCKSNRDSSGKGETHARAAHPRRASVRRN